MLGTESEEHKNVSECISKSLFMYYIKKKKYTYQKKKSSKKPGVSKARLFSKKSLVIPFLSIY